MKVKYFLFRNDPGSPVMSILCGVIGAVVVVFLVIIITMKVNHKQILTIQNWKYFNPSNQFDLEVWDGAPVVIFQLCCNENYSNCFDKIIQQDIFFYY